MARGLFTRTVDPCIAQRVCEKLRKWVGISALSFVAMDCITFIDLLNGSAFVSVVAPLSRLSQQAQLKMVYTSSKLIFAPFRVCAVQELIAVPFAKKTMNPSRSCSCRPVFAVGSVSRCGDNIPGRITRHDLAADRGSIAFHACCSVSGETHATFCPGGGSCHLREAGGSRRPPKEAHCSRRGTTQKGWPRRVASMEG